MIISDPATENDAINNFTAILSYSGLIGDQNGTPDNTTAEEWSRPSEKDPIRLAQKVYRRMGAPLSLN